MEVFLVLILSVGLISFALFPIVKGWYFNYMDMSPSEKAEFREHIMDHIRQLAFFAGIGLFVLALFMINWIVGLVITVLAIVAIIIVSVLRN